MNQTLETVIELNDIIVREGATLNAPNLTEVSGCVDVHEGGTLTAPNLTEVRGSVYVYEGATIIAPLIGYPN